MHISVITPVYHGNKYLNKYMKMMEKAAEPFAAQGNSVEVILVNDSPDVDIVYDGNLVKSFRVSVINNNENIGIHGSRVNGLNNCSGDYIVFLDQDDIISHHCFTTHAKAIKDGDISLGNGILEAGIERNDIFGGKFSQKFASRPWVYIWIRDFIVSPGQCLIKKSAIPEYWKEHILSANGTDDYLLWLLMFNNGSVMNCNYHKVYLHCDTGENVSSDSGKMFESTKELLAALETCPDYNKSVSALIKRRIYYKEADRGNKKEFVLKSIKNMDVFLVNVFYRIVWRGCLVSKK